MAHLYEITSDLLEVFRVLESYEDEVPADVMEQLKGLERSLDQKLAACCSVRSEVKSEAEMLALEIERLQKRKKACERRVEHLEAYMMDSLVQLNQNSMDVDGKWTIRIQNTTPSVKVFDESVIPDKFKETVTDTKLLKSEISKAMKAGQDVPGCSLVTGKTVRIY